MGMIVKARSGEWCGGIALLGYHWAAMEGQNTCQEKSPD